MTRKNKRKPSSGIRIETIATPSPERVPSKKLRLLPSPPMTRMLRRKGSPTCSIFGLNRGLLYPDYFFCHNCDEWDTDSILGIKKKKSCPAYLRCTANHTSFCFPKDKMEVSNLQNGSPKRSRRPIQSQRNELPAEPSICSDLLPNDTFCKKSMGINLNESALPPAQYDESEYYKKELQRKDEEIKKLTRQLETSAKLVKFYKRKVSSSGAPVQEQSNERVELDWAILDSINDMICSD